MTTQSDNDDEVDQKRVTMMDVARAAGVSKITVSRALRTPEKVRPETRARVNEAVRELGYQPDAAAGTLASGNRPLVGAIIPTLDGSIFGTTIEGLSAQLRSHGYDLVFGTTEYSVDVEAEVIASMAGYRPSGLIVTGSVHSDEGIRRLAAMPTTVVEIWELPEKPIDVAVGFSNVDASIAMTRFLYDLGRRRIVYIGGGPTSDFRSRLRQEGVTSACRALGLGDPPIIPYDRSVPSASERGAAAMRWILTNCPDTDAVFCTSDAVAIGALGEAWRQGKNVPDDIAVAGHGDFEIAGDCSVGITTVRIPGFQIGKTAAQLIIDRVRGLPRERRVFDLGYEIVRRGTA